MQPCAPSTPRRVTAEILVHFGYPSSSALSTQTISICRTLCLHHPYPRYHLSSCVVRALPPTLGEVSGRSGRTMEAAFNLHHVPCSMSGL